MDIIVSEETHGATFLSILDDKNKAIDLLKQRLENQKLQILYYLKRELKYTKVIELSRTCRTENSEDLPVVLAFTQFRNQNRLKSNILRLYEYMEHVDKKLNRNLTCQEFILRKIVEKLCQVIRNSNEKSVSETRQNVYMDLFNSLLENTVGLRKKLDCFRICCNRLILIEDERNSIVEQVINLPVEQRIHCNFLISIKQERMELEKKIKEIKEHQEGQREDKRELSYLEDKIKSSIKEIEDFSTAEDMVADLKLEAKSLLNSSEQRKKKLQWQQIVNLISLAANGEELHTENNYQQNMFQAIKKEINYLQTRLKNELQVTKIEHERTKCELKTVLQEKNELKLIKSELQSSLKKIQKTHATEMASLKQQRDLYKNQVEDLELVKEAYTQLLIKPNSESSHKENEMTKTVKHLEKKICLMNQMINKQNKEIILQNDFIENLKSFHKMNKEQKYNNNNNQGHSSKEKKVNFSREKLNCKTPLTIPASSEKGIQNKKVVKEIIQNVLKDIRSNKKTNVASFALQIKCSCKDGNRLENCPCNELELMRDCSHESLPVFCTPINKNKNNNIDIKSKNGYSRNIEVLVQKNKLHSSSDDFNLSAF